MTIKAWCDVDAFDVDGGTPTAGSHGTMIRQAVILALRHIHIDHSNLVSR